MPHVSCSNLRANVLTYEVVPLLSESGNGIERLKGSKGALPFQTRLAYMSGFHNSFRCVLLVFSVFALDLDMKYL